MNTALLQPKALQSIRPSTRPARAAARRSRFTLIELLVVIAILLILIAMLLPSLERARHQAAIVVCLANLNQQGTGSMSFMANRDRSIPMLITHMPNQVKRSPYDTHTPDLRAEYLEITGDAPELLYCPLNEAYDMDSQYGWNRADVDGWAFMDYNFVAFYDDGVGGAGWGNQYYVRDLFPYTAAAGRLSSNIPHRMGALYSPELTAISVDAQASRHGVWPGKGVMPTWWIGWENFFGHRDVSGMWEGASAVYFDGHAKHGYRRDMVDYSAPNWGAGFKMNYFRDQVSAEGHFMWWP